jgi:hypothetical protein
VHGFKAQSGAFIAPINLIKQSPHRDLLCPQAAPAPVAAPAPAPAAAAAPVSASAPAAAAAAPAGAPVAAAPAANPFAGPEFESNVSCSLAVCFPSQESSHLIQLTSANGIVSG